MDVLKEEMARQAAYRVAAADFVRASREFLGSAQAVAVAAKRWDPAGEKSDPGVMAMVETAEMLLTAACASSPGVRAVLAAALAASAPPTPEAPAAQETTR